MEDVHVLEGEYPGQARGVVIRDQPIRPMKLDYQFLAQIFENLMRAGGYYSLFFQKHNTHPNMKISAKKQ